jgi:hypothetical protein
MERHSIIFSQIWGDGLISFALEALFIGLVALLGF